MAVPTVVGTAVGATKFRDRLIVLVVQLCILNLVQVQLHRVLQGRITMKGFKRLELL